MKKIMKKISYFTKVFLAVGLLVNSLSPLSIVFADVTEGNEGEDTVLTENNETEGEDEKVGKNLTEDDEGEKEKTDGEATDGEGTEGEEVTTGEETTGNEESTEGEGTDGEGTTPGEEVTTGEEITGSEEGTEGEGTGEEETTTGEEVTTGEETTGSEETTPDETENTTGVGDEGTETQEEVVVSESFEYSVLVDGVEVSANDGVYTVDSSSTKVEIIGTLTTDNQDASAVYMYDELDYTVEELKEGLLIQEFELPGYLYGEFEVSASAVLTNDQGEEVTLQPLEGTIAYGTPEEVAYALNDGATDNGYSYYYSFDIDNTLNVVALDEEQLEKIINSAFCYATYEINDNMLELSDDHGVTVTFEIVMHGDVDGDGDVDEDDLIALIQEVLDPSGDSGLNTDINNDETTDIIDVILLSCIVKTGTPYTEVADEEITIESQFEEFNDSVENGSEFTLKYVAVINEDFIGGFAGQVNYDSSVLELVGIKSEKFATGHYVDDGRFVFLGDTLRGEMVTETDEEGNEIIHFEDMNYVILNITLKPIATGTTTVSMDDVNFFWMDTRYKGNAGDSIDITVETSNDSSLSSLTIGGVEVPLEEGKNEYAITVGSDVTVADIEAVLANSGANIELDAPDELVDGENTIRIVVTAEDGVTTTEYVVTVTREAANQEETTTYDNYYQEGTATYDNTESTVEPSKPASSEKDTKPVEPEKEKKSNLSKIIITALILLVIAALIYLIFKDDDDDETKKANKEIDKLKKEDIEPKVHEVNKKEPPKKVNKNNKKGR